MKRTCAYLASLPLLCLLIGLPVRAEKSVSLPDLGERIGTFQSHKSALDPRQRAVMEKAASDLAKDMPAPGLKVGSAAPEFTLPDAFGKPVTLKDLLRQGPVVLTFYRGAWCPYCNLQLHALKESLPHFQRYGAQLVAVTPQKPDRSRDQIDKDAYPFPILSDLDNRVMQAYNLYFEVPEELRTLYIQDFNLDLADYNGAGRYGLPVPGTFVIDRQGIIRAAFADTDYKKRMEPAAIVEALFDIEANPHAGAKP